MAFFETTIAGIRASTTASISDQYYVTDLGKEGFWWFDPLDTTSADDNESILINAVNNRFKRVLSIFKTTIAEIRTLTSASISTQYYTTDKGKEGFWYFDDEDSSSLDNLGTILVNANNQRFKRVYDKGVVNVKWFGAKGEIEYTPVTGTVSMGISIPPPPLDPYRVINTNAVFSASDKGKFVIIKGAGVLGEDLKGRINVVVSAFEVALNTRYATVVSGAKMFIGDPIDDTTAIQNAINFISATDFESISRRSSGGGTVFFPEGIYMITETLLVGQQCKLLGVSKSMDYFPISDPVHDWAGQYYSRGSVILCDFNNNDEDTLKWAISNSCWRPDVPPPIPPLPPKYQIYPYSDSKSGFEADNYVYGITIEGLFIDGGDPYINDSLNTTTYTFGGIRLIGANSSSIINCTTYRTRFGYFFNVSFNNSISGCIGKNFEFGLVVKCVNILNISSCDFGMIPIEEQYTASNSISELMQEGYELNFNQFINVKNTYSGIILNEATSCSLINVGVEQNWKNGIIFFLSNASMNACYLENISEFAIAIGGSNSIIIANDTFFSNIETLFYFGNYANATINGIFNSGKSRQNLLFYPSKDSDTGEEIIHRTVIFTNTKYYKCIYAADIVFSDWINKGEVYVDPNGNDDNYGFYDYAPLKTFDAALIRVQNQSTLNPIKTIYIKAAPVIGEGVSAQNGAVIKDLKIVSIENADILITTYDIDLEANPPRIKGRIFFEGLTSQVAQIGQIELLGNVNMYFRNVDLICNLPLILPLNTVNMSMFGLRNSFGKLTFNNDSIFSPPYDIELRSDYSIVQSNLTSLTMASPLSLVEIKFLNIAVNGGTLSPLQTGAQTLGVDCVQIASTRTGGGWQDAIIIRNNF